MSEYLGNSSNIWVFGEFPSILEISSHLRNFQNFKNIPHSDICRYLGNPIFDIFDNCCHSLHSCNQYNYFDVKLKQYQLYKHGIGSYACDQCEYVGPELQHLKQHKSN